MIARMRLLYAPGKSYRKKHTYQNKVNTHKSYYARAKQHNPLCRHYALTIAYNSMTIHYSRMCHFAAFEGRGCGVVDDTCMQYTKAVTAQ